MGRSLWKCYLIVTISSLCVAHRIVKMLPTEASDSADAGSEVRVARQAPTPARFTKSRFLSMAVGILKMKGGEYQDILEYLTSTPEIEDEIIKQNVINKFTMFVPNDQGLRRYLLADAPNPFVISPKLRKSMLMDLIVKGGLRYDNLVNGAKFTTLGGKTFTVAVKDGVVSLGDRAAVTENTETRVWSFGSLIFTDSPIFVDFAGMEEAINQFHQQVSVPGRTGKSFVATATEKLKGNPGAAAFQRYLEQTPEFQTEVVAKSGKEHTLIVPSNFGIRRWLPADAVDPFFVSATLRKKMLADHVIVGRVKPEQLVNGAQFTTLSGKTIAVTLQDGRAMLGDRASVTDAKGLSDTAIPFLTTDSLVFVDRDGISNAIREYYKQNPSVGPFGIRPPAVVNVPGRTGKSFVATATEKLKSNPDADAFQGYLEQTPEFETQVAAKSGTEYTLVVPSSFGIRRWIPADAVNPFFVSATLRKQMLADHVIVGRVKPEQLVNGAQFTTLSGKTVALAVQDGELTLGGRAVVTDTKGLSDPDVPIIATDSLVFVDRQGISDSIREYNRKNPSSRRFGARPPAVVSRSAPRLTKSMFLSAAMEKLKSVEDAGYFQDYLQKTPDFERELVARAGLEYTLAVPSAWGIIRWLPADAADPFLVNDALRKEMISDHVIIGRVKIEDLKDGATFTTLSGKSVTVKLQDGQTLLGDRATVTDTKGLNDDAAPFLMTDSLLFVDFDKISKAISDHHEKNPFPGPFGIPPPPTVSVERESRAVKSAFLSAAIEKLQSVRDSQTFQELLESAPELDDEIIAHGDNDFTLVVPPNWGISRWLPADTINPYRTSNTLRYKMLADHVIIGKVKKEDLVNGAKFNTLSGKTIEVKVEEGQILLSDRASLMSAEGLADPVAPYMSTDGLIFVDFDGISEAIRDYHTKNPSGEPFLKAPEESISVMAESVDPVEEKRPEALFSSSPFLSRTYANIQKNDNFATFRRYLEKGVQLEEELRSAGDSAGFTMVIPDNFGIIRWLLQDTADPFSVSDTLRKQMLSDHVIRGKLSTADLVDGAQLNTLSGKQVDVKMENGVIHLGDRATVTSSDGLSDSTAPYLTTDSMLFIDFDGMQEALREYHEKNPVQTPWFSVDVPAAVVVQAEDQELVHPFLQQVQTVLSAGRLQQDMRLFTEYFTTSDKLSKKLFEKEAGNPAKYTIFASVTEGIRRNLPRDVADPFVLNAELRNEMLLDHIVQRKIEHADLTSGANFESINGRSIEVSIDGGSLVLNKRASVISGPFVLGDDGYLYITSNMLFFDMDKIQRAIEAGPQVSPFMSETIEA